MPVTPLPPNYTPVLFTHYSFGPVSHTMQVRMLNSSYLPAAVAAVGDIFDLLAPILDSSFAILGADFREASGIVSLPTSPPVMSVTPAGGTVNAYRRPREFTWIGRGDTTGRRGWFNIYGINVAEAGDFRYQVGEITEFDDVLAYLATTPAGVITTIAGDAIQFKQYVNVNWNSHWETASR